MVDDDEWEWVAEHATGGFDHLLIGTSLPLLLGPGHALRRGVERGGRRRRLGPARGPLGEKLRRAADLEHWAAFQESFAPRWSSCSAAVGAGERGEPPASIVTLSGDVHHAYLAEVGFPRGTGRCKSQVWQAVCSPFRNPLEKKERELIRCGCRARSRSSRARWRGGGRARPRVGWRLAATARGSTTRWRC